LFGRGLATEEIDVKHGSMDGKVACHS
jgi:hypothetical protein